MSAKFFRSFNTDHGELLHFVEPVLAYEYADGDILEAGSKKLDLVEERKEKNAVSLSIINRIVSMRSDKRFEPFYLRVTQLYYVNPGGSGDLNKRFDDTRIEAILRLNETVSVDADTKYSHDDSDFVSFNTDLKVTGDNSYFNVGQRYSRTGSIEFLTADAGIEKNRINTSIGIWYDNKDHVMRETNYSIRYGEQCWGVSFSYKYRPDEEQFSVLLTLKGVGSVGKM